MDRGRYFLYMKKYLQCFLGNWAEHRLAKETLANVLGSWETSLFLPRGKGGWHRPQAPNVTQTPIDPAVLGITPLHQAAPQLRNTSSTVPRKGTDSGWETSCAPWDQDLPFACGRGAQGARMLPRQEGIKRSVWPKSCTPRNKQKLQTWGLGVPPMPFGKPGMPDPALLKGNWGQGQQPWGRPRWEWAPWLRLGFLTQVLGGFSSRTWFTGPLPTDKILLLYIGRLRRRRGLGLSRLVAVQVPDSPVPSLP